MSASVRWLVVIGIVIFRRESSDRGMCGVGSVGASQWGVMFATAASSSGGERWDAGS